MKYGYMLFRPCSCPIPTSIVHINNVLFWFLFRMQDPGAFAIAQALKANEDIAVTSLNLSNNFLTKFGQVVLSPLLVPHPHLIKMHILIVVL